MNKLLFSIAIVVIIASAFLFISINSNTELPQKTTLVEAPSSIGTKEDPWKRFNYENRQLIDPATGQIPDDIHKKEAGFVKSIPTIESVNQKRNYSY